VGYDAEMTRNKLLVATGICLALIAYASLAALTGRPVLVGHHEAYWVVVIERFSAYALLGFLLAFLLPGRFTYACGLVIGVAVTLELLQALRPDRDAALFDVIQKAAGGVVGVAIAQSVLAYLPRARS
jgi:VanZ family protein